MGLRSRLGTQRTTLPDLARSGLGGLDPGLLRTELGIGHRVRAREFIAAMLPPGGVGAEIGVFTGMFSPVLLDVARPREMHFVDVWWEAFGDSYPDWGAYTAHGRLGTRTAHAAAARRIARRAGQTDCRIVADYSANWLAGLPEHYLDWAYLDTGHTYEGTAEELRWLATRLRPGGILIGDDWDEDPASPHHGVTVAGREAVASGAFELVGTYGWKQYALRATGR